MIGLEPVLTTQVEQHVRWFTTDVDRRDVDDDSAEGAAYRPPIRARQDGFGTRRST